MSSVSYSQLPPIAQDILRLVRRGAHTLIISGFTLIGVTYSCFLALSGELPPYFSYYGLFVLIGALVTMISSVLLLLLGCLALRFYKQPLHHLTFVKMTQKAGTAFGFIYIIGSILALALYWLFFRSDMVLFAGVGAFVAALMLIFFVAGDWVNKVMKKWMLRTGDSHAEINQLIQQIIQTEEDPTTRQKEKT